MIYRDTYIVGGRTSEGLPASPGDIRAYDVRSGQLKWSWNSGTRAQGRGVTYWSSGNERRLLASFGRYIYAVDPATGRPFTNFGRDGRNDDRKAFHPLQH